MFPIFLVKAAEVGPEISINGQFGSACVAIAAGKAEKQIGAVLLVKGVNAEIVFRAVGGLNQLIAGEITVIRRPGASGGGGIAARLAEFRVAHFTLGRPLPLKCT